MSQEQKKIVIIGGGFAGSTAAEKLEKNFDVTLIDTKDFYEYTPSILRTIVEPQHIKKIQRVHSHYLKKARFIRGVVAEVTKKDVVLENKQHIPFDYLIICSGSTYNTPIKEHNIVMATRADMLRNYYEKLCRAESVTIIGGGIVGVELAAEIAERYKDKNIMLVHSRDKLMPRCVPKVCEYSEKYLRKKGVKIIFNERIENSKGNTFITKKGTRLHADMAFLCTGIKPNSGFMKKSFGKNLDDRDHIIVNENMQMPGYPNIFVAGDVTGIKEEKTAQNAEIHAEIIVDNIKNTEQGKPLKTYTSKQRTMAISLGKYNGIIIHPKFVLTGLIPAVIKWAVELRTMLKY